MGIGWGSPWGSQASGAFIPNVQDRRWNPRTEDTKWTSPAACSGREGRGRICCEDKDADSHSLVEMHVRPLDACAVFPVAKLQPTDDNASFNVNQTYPAYSGEMTTALPRARGRPPFMFCRNVDELFCLEMSLVCPASHHSAAH